MKMMIRTLISSPSNFILEADIFPSFPRKTFKLKLLHLDSSLSTILKPIPLRSSSIKASQINSEAAEIEAIDESRRKTVRVRFQLRKECVFGEHFFILGDDLVFGGLWDPENALPLNWSDGNVWTIELDLPVGRLVEFKFILKATTGEMLWQPGPNRALETWESNKTIRICEDWENADLQMMIEEDVVLINQEEKESSIVNSDIPIVAGNITHPKESGRLNNDAEKDDEVPGCVQQVLVENAGYTSNETTENSSSHSQSEKTMEPSNGALTARVVTEEAMFIEEESPVLVPGLIPLSDWDNEEVEVLNEGKAETFPEVDEKHQAKRERHKEEKVKAISLFEKPEKEAEKVVEQRHDNAAEEEMQQQQQWLETEPLGTPDVLIEKDIQWGRRTLLKLLSNFGLL